MKGILLAVATVTATVTGLIHFGAMAMPKWIVDVLPQAVPQVGPAFGLSTAVAAILIVLLSRK